MRRVIPPNFVLLYDIALHGLNQGKPIYKTFSFANFFIFTNQAVAQQQSFAYLHYFWQRNQKKSFSRNSIFSLFFFEYERNFYMTLVSDSPHVASLLRINISKLGCALQARFTTFIYRNVVLALLELRQCTQVHLRPLGLDSFYAIALTSLCSSGSISLNSSATFSLDSLRAFIGLQLFP